MASPSSSSCMRLSSENNSNKRSGMPPSHPNNPTASLPPPSQIIGYSPSSQQDSTSHSRSLSQSTFFSLNTTPPWSSPPYLDPSVPSLSDHVCNGVSMEKRVANSNIRPSLPSLGRGSNEFCVGDSSGLPPRRGHRRSSSDFPLGSSTMIRSSSPQTNSIGNAGVKEPVQLVKRELADDLFSVYMNLENLETLNSSGTEDKDLDSGSVTKTHGGKSSDNEVESSVNEHPINIHGHGMSSGVSIEKKEGVKRRAAGDIAPTLLKGSLQFYEESTKRNQGVRRSTGSNEFNEAELKRIMENENLAEIASVDPKRAKRILANRQSAVRSKERKRRHIEELEHKLQTLQMEATTLSAQLTVLQRDSFGLTSQNNELKFRLEAMEKQAQLKDALNEALAAEVHRLELAAAELSGEAQQLSINHRRSQSHPQQPNVHQIQQHQHQKRQQRLRNQQQNGEPAGNESKS